MFFFVIRTAHLVLTPLPTTEFQLSVFTIVCIGKFILRSAGKNRQATRRRTISQPCCSLPHPLYCRQVWKEDLRFPVKRITAQLTLVLLIVTLIVPGFIFAQSTSSSTSPGTGYPAKKPA